MIIRDYLKQNETIIDRLVKIGIMPCNIRSQILIYDQYIDYKRQGSKRFVAIQSVADDERISFSTAYRIIQKMEQSV